MRVPTERGIGGNAVQRDLDEWNATLDQPPGQQAALSKRAAAILVAQASRFAGNIKRLGRFATHHLHGFVIRRTVAVDLQASPTLGEVDFQVVQ